MKVAEQRQHEFAPDGGKGVSIEEQKRRAAMIDAEAVAFRQASAFRGGAFPSPLRTPLQFPS